MNAKKLENIRLKKLRPHPNNPNQLNEENFVKLKQHIARTGQYPSLIVRPVGDSYQLLDGYHRWLALQELGYEEASCEVWDVDDTEAKILLATLNRLRGVDEPKLRAQLLGSIIAESDYDITRLFPESERSLQALLHTLDVVGDVDIESEQGLIEAQLIQSGVAEEKATRIADQYHPPATHAVMKFVFFSETDYNKVVQYFGTAQPSTKQLVQLIESHGSTQT